MKPLDIPATFVLDLGYRKVTLYQGIRNYPDEIGNSPKAARYLVEPMEAAAEPPAAPPIAAALAPNRSATISPN